MIRTGTVCLLLEDCCILRHKSFLLKKLLHLPCLCCCVFSNDTPVLILLILLLLLLLLLLLRQLNIPYLSSLLACPEDNKNSSSSSCADMWLSFTFLIFICFKAIIRLLLYTCWDILLSFSFSFSFPIFLHPSLRGTTSFVTFPSARGLFSPDELPWRIPTYLRSIDYALLRWALWVLGIRFFEIQVMIRLVL